MRGAVMIQTRSLRDSGDKYLRNSLRAYLENEPGCDLRWIESYFRSARAETREVMETYLAQYAETERYRELMARL
jgi:hypothetical protein